MTAYARGAKRELDVVKLSRLEGWVADRVAGSHGPADVVRMRDGQRPQRVQVKCDKRSAFANFPPTERRALVEEAVQAGAEAWLCHWPPDRRGPRWIPDTDWP